MTEALSPAIGWASLVFGVLATLVGLVIAWNQRNLKPPTVPAAKLDEQGFTDTLKATTDFAKALKDLDRGMQLIMVGILFFGIAALVAGMDTVATAIESAAGG